MRPPTLAIDFDRVIHDTDNPAPGRRMGPPLQGATNSMWALRRGGYRLIIFTTNRVEPVVAWLDHFHVPYDNVTNTKPDADLYIDDKALHHVDWPTTMTEIERRARQQ